MNSLRSANLTRVALSTTSQDGAAQKLSDTLTHTQNGNGQPLSTETQLAQPLQSGQVQSAGTDTEQSQIVTYQRKCKNWLKTFGDWTLPRSEAAESFIFWTGLFTIASALRKHVRVPDGYMGSWEVVPNMYVLFIGPPGSRKSTTLRYAKTLLRDIPNLTKAPDMITKESILETIVKSPDCAMTAMASEFSEFIVKSGTDMYGFLTNIYDGQTDLGSSTRSRGLELAEEPCFNLIGATTPVWIAANMPESVIGGGFASRVIFIYEESVRRRQLLYHNLKKEYGETYFDDLKKDLISDLAHIALNLHGVFELTEESADYLDKWYKEVSERDSNINHKLQGYVERRPAYVLKLSMILHLAREDTLIIDLQDILQAIELLKQVEAKLPETFQAVGKNPFTSDIRNILNYVKQKGRVSERELRREFRSAALPNQLTDLLNDLILSGDLKLVIDASLPENQRRFFAIGKQ